MTVEEILAQQTTKTRKMVQLLQLGFTRRQVADTMGVGYGFVQNVYAKYVRETAAQFMSTLFNKKFGVEIEAYNVEKSTLARKIRSLGVDVEIEGYNHNTRRHWKIVYDSSIRGNKSFEIVSPILEGEQGLEELQKVCQALKACNAYINKSCGLHIHFDASQMKLKHWKNLLTNYVTYEPLIDSMMPNSRRGNNNQFCQSMKIRNAKSRIEAATSLTKLQNIYRSRYFKTNLQSFSRHNTIEFRHHSGTIEFEKISNWVRFLHNLVEYSKTNKIKQATFESIKKFNQQEIVNFYHNRIQDLAA